MFASQVLFFFGADRRWCLEHVLPLLAWTDPKLAHRTWDGFLAWGRWNDHLLAAGLQEHYATAAAHLDDFRDDLRRQLCRHLAAVALQSELEGKVEWLHTITTALPPQGRVEWMNQVTWLLRALAPAAVEHQWQEWIARYWEDRLNSIPVQLSGDEASAMAAWAVYLTNSVEQAVDLATKRPAGLQEHGDVLRDLEDGQRLDLSPVAFARLIGHLLRNTTAPFWGARHLTKIVPRLRDKVDASELRRLVEEALRLGCNDAPTW